jgi:hypothetical protein
MAFETVSGIKNYKKSNEIKLGEFIEGYVTGQQNSGLYPEIDQIVMKTKKGEQFILSPHGSLKFFFKNGNKPGYYYRFTRMEDTKNKRAQPICQFKVEVDKTDMLPEFKTPVAVAATPAVTTDHGAEEQIPF